MEQEDCESDFITFVYERDRKTWLGDVIIDMSINIKVNHLGCCWERFLCYGGTLGLIFMRFLFGRQRKLKTRKTSNKFL